MSLEDLRDEVMNGPKKEHGDLEARLRAIPIGTMQFYRGMFKKADPVPVTLGELRLASEIIAQIDQAYTDAGHVHYATFRTDLQQTFGLMTGEEWLDKFYDYLPNEADVPQPTWKHVYDAAKRAAGIDL